LNVPFDVCGGVRPAEQVQFDPMEILAALITELHDRGGRLVTGQRVHAASTENGRVRLRLRATDGREQIAEADHCVLATGNPILDRGGFFARLHPPGRDPDMERRRTFQGLPTTRFPVRSRLRRTRGAGLPTFRSPFIG
jgi:glycine/D-amino acid oxidase-like deaminating enzyme